MQYKYLVNFEIESFNNQKNAFEVVQNPNVLISVTEAHSGHRISEQDAAATGRVVFTASEAGNHLVCFKHSSSGFFSNKKSKITVEVLIGEHGAEISPEVDSRLKG
jgi:DNA integrity scanning protein DisA with diadenylate cyclase activity